jgi:bifunctional non-homologous end joining protein LigD
MARKAHEALAGVPGGIRLQVVSPSAKPPGGDGWLHEVKHDGHRLIAVVAASGSLKLLSRRGIDRTELFREPFRQLIESGRAMVLDGEIAAPDERGMTHLDWLTDALADGRPERLAYFAFDLLHLDGEDLRLRPIEHRKTALRDLLAASGVYDRIVYVDHVIGGGTELFKRVEEMGAEGIVSKRLGQPYRGGVSRDWLKTKCHQIDRFVITGFQELGEERLEAIHVAELCDDELRPAGQVRWGFAGKGLWDTLDALRDGSAQGGIMPVAPVLSANVKFCGRHKGGAIRDGVIVSLVAPAVTGPVYGCDCDQVIAAFDAFEVDAARRTEMRRHDAQLRARGV